MTNTDTKRALIEVHAALRAGQRTPPFIAISRDPREAMAYALEVIRGDDDITTTKREALDQLATRIDRFIEGDSDDALRELAATMPMMEAMMVRYAIEAAQTNDLDRKYRLTKLSLQCQASFSRTLALLAGLKTQRKGQGHVSISEYTAD